MPLLHVGDLNFRPVGQLHDVELANSVSLMTVFVWVRFLSVLLLPLSFYAAARLLELPLPAALAAAVMSPLISSAGLFGLAVASPS